MVAGEWGDGRGGGSPVFPLSKGGQWEAAENVAKRETGQQGGEDQLPDLMRRSQEPRDAFSVAPLPKLFSFSICPMSGLPVGGAHSFQSTGRCFGSTPGLLTSGGTATAAKAAPDARFVRPCSGVGRGKWQKECKFCPKSPISEATPKTLNLKNAIYNKQNSSLISNRLIFLLFSAYQEKQS